MRLLLCFCVLCLACGDDDGSPDAATADAAISDASISDAPMPDAVAMMDADMAQDATVDGSADAGDDAMAGDTWESFANDFMQTYCVECHPGASGTRDYQTIDDVRRDRETIRCGVTPIALDDCSGFPPPAQFPVGDGPQPSDAERTRLVEWIDADLP